ncbi:hypothetical protein [Streptosporangium lutulentum]|uniref:Uncharacterized protein n=1 Tax=Streptosporangium lutulentum TaxID=1461250 RepID=A0ABT9QLC8_9ACTN|nr:hypothetical protein [Streptosporangium lutulentum]MDP9847558.1 hypothetical protein [Streptosporangium lutulentum]
MTYKHMIETAADLNRWEPEDLDAFLAVDEHNAEHSVGVPPIINPALGLVLVYRPVGYITEPVTAVA